MPTNPADSPILGTLYGSDAMRAVFDEQALFQRMLDVEAALARTQARLGIIPAEAAQSIGRAARLENLNIAELAESARTAGAPVVGVVAGLSRAAGDAGAWTHWGATTQDIVDTAIVLQIRDGLGLIRASLREHHQCTCCASRSPSPHRDGRAYLPATGSAHDTRPEMRDLGAAADRPHRPPRHAPPTCRAGQLWRRRRHACFARRPGHRHHGGTGRRTGPGRPAAPWHVNREAFAETVAFLGLVCGSLAKFATDIILLTQSEVGEVAEPYFAGRGASSTMPQKRNPIASTYIVAAARNVHALVPVMLGAMAADQERPTGAWQAEWLALPPAFVLTHGALDHATTIAQGMVADPANMRRNLDLTHGLIVAEAVMMGLAPQLGRAEAHHVVKHACDVALTEAIPLADALAREPAIASKLDRAEIERLTDPANYLGSTDAFIDRVLALAT